MDTVLAVLPLGAKVTLTAPSTQNGFIFLTDRGDKPVVNGK